MFERVWTTCSKLANHSRLNIQHNCGDLDVCSLQFEDEQDIHTNSKVYEKMGTNDLD